MKNIVFLIISLFYLTKITGQSFHENIVIYYGGNYFMPSKGYAHCIGVQKKISSSRFGDLNGEISILFGGPFSFTFSDQGIDIENPYKVFHATIGTNLEMNINSSKKCFISIGIHGGYSRYEIPVTVDNIPLGNGASIKGYFSVRKNGIFASTLRYYYWFEGKKLRVAIVPNYSFYLTSMKTSSLGVILQFKF